MVTKIIESPHRFKERICAYGGAGTGKSTITLNIARYRPMDTFHIIDMDYSMTYERLLATEYQDVLEQGNVIIHEIDAEWSAFAQQFADIVEKEDSENAWLTIDPATVTWEIVQAWWLETVQGTDIADYMAQLRRDTGDSKEYSAALAEAMQWPAINKQYQQKFYRNLHKWRGHSIICCEAAELGRQEGQDEQALYGFIGYKPKGQKAMPHASATNIFLDHPKINEWRFTTAKDRGRELQEKTPLEEFAIDYLVDVGGWEMKMQRAAKKPTAKKAAAK